MSDSHCGGAPTARQQQPMGGGLSDGRLSHVRRARLRQALGLCAAVLVLGGADARADGKTRFNGTTGGTTAAAQVAALSMQNRLVDTRLASQRAKGPAPDSLSASDGSKVAVILWDDAWSELQRRAHLRAAANAGGRAGNSLAGTTGR